jgi:peptidoglycan/LPS O-acetylase OafA/YrhL
MKDGSTGRAGVPVLSSLTGMRFVAALLVFLTHAMLENFFADPKAQSRLFSVFWQGGWESVGFFFVLSGFVLTWSVRTTETTRTFWRRRFFKIYPNHIVTFIAAAILLVTVSHQAITGWHGLLNLFLLQDYVPQGEVRTGFNAVSWTLSCEALFYFAFPLLHGLIKRIPVERLWVWTLGVMALVVAVPFAAMALPAGPRFPMVGLTDTELYIVVQFPPVRILEFVFGILLARLVSSGRRLPFGLGGAMTVAVLCYALAGLFPATFQIAVLASLPLGFVIAAAARDDLANRPSFLRSKLMVRLGELSFAFYMVHWLVLTYGHQLIGGRSFSTPVALLVVAGFLAVALAGAWVLYTLVEDPIMRRFGSASRTVAPAVALRAAETTPGQEAGKR